MVDHPEHKEPKKLQIWLPILLSLMMVGGMLIGINLQPQSPRTKIVIENELPASYIGQGRVEELIRYIEAKYVDEVDSEQLIESAIASLMKELDPHSNYLSAEQVLKIREDMQGNFKGIGVEFMLLDDTIVVIKPIENGPSIKAGLLAGDRIVEINDTIVAGNDVEIDAVKNMLRGESGTEVKVGILREGDSSTQQYMIKRGDIPIHSIDIATMLDEKTGYIRVNRFSATTYSEFMKGLEGLVEKNMKDLVIDLRGNPGGYLEEATKILSQLFKGKKQLLVYTQRRSAHRKDYESTGQTFFDVGNIIVLIDEQSASASEILAGAIQDLDRGTIIGRRSFGKGLVQEQYSLKDGSALRLTVARFYTPSGRSIQRPYSGKSQEYDDDLDARYHRGELVDGNKVVRNDTLVYTTKNGRKIYGGGGIMPDVFVPIDTIVFNTYYNALLPHLSSFAYRYYWKNKSMLNFNSLDDFIQRFEISEDTIDDFLAYTTSKKVTRDTNQLFRIKSQIKEDLKMQIARHLHGEEGIFAVSLPNDNMIREALKVLNSPNQLVIKNTPQHKTENEEF